LPGEKLLPISINGSRAIRRVGRVGEGYTTSTLGGLTYLVRPNADERHKKGPPVSIRSLGQYRATLEILKGKIRTSSKTAGEENRLDRRSALRNRRILEGQKVLSNRLTFSRIRKGGINKAGCEESSLTRELRKLFPFQQKDRRRGHDITHSNIKHVRRRSFSPIGPWSSVDNLLILLFKYKKAGTGRTLGRRKGRKARRASLYCKKIYGAH